MAKTIRDTFLLRHDFYPQIKILAIEQRGILFTAIYAYETGDELPDMDPLTAMCWGFIKSSLDSNKDKYEAQCEANRTNGTKGGRPARNNRPVSEENPNNRTVFNDNRPVSEENPTKTAGFSKNPIDIDSDIDSDIDFKSDSDSVSVSDSDSRGVTEKERERFFEIFFFRNFQNPAYEVERFVNHYSAQGWCRKDSTTPVTDRIALAKTWQQEDKNAPIRFPPAFLNGWEVSYKELKKSDPAGAKMMLTDLKAVGITPKRIRLWCTERLERWMSHSSMCFRVIWLNKFHPGCQLSFEKS